MCATLVVLLIVDSSRLKCFVSLLINDNIQGKEMLSYGNCFCQQKSVEEQDKQTCPILIAGGTRETS